jgi:cell division protein FtsI (penicillin-binding protein 3)
VQRGDPGRRVGLTVLVIAIALTLFAGRLVQLQGMESGYYKQLANNEKLTTIALPALRGFIYGSNGEILAMTVETYTVWSDPQNIPDGQLPTVAARTAGALGLTTSAVLNLLQHPSSAQYVVLANDVSAGAEATLAGLNLDGVYATGSYARVYPNGTATANVVGLTNVNKADVISGYSGLEEEYNSLLTGTAGSEQVEKSASGQTIPLAGTQETPAKNGESIKLTINPTLQYQAQQACEQQVEKTKAQNCSVVVMQPKTGAILAMAQWPNPGNGYNIADQYMFAPGSTAKVITAAAAFENSSVTPATAYNIPYQIFRGGQWIHDAEWSPGERYTVAGIIANSSNVGMSQVVQSVPEPVQYQYLKNFGLGEPTGLGLPDEEPSASYAPYALAPVSKWAADERYTLSYGQGISVNAVQMASVYATIANGGVRVQPTLIAGTYNAAGQYTEAKAPQSTRVIAASTAKELVSILQQVPAVDNQADQRWGDIAGYAIAAKTGTSSENASDGEKACPKGNPLCVHGSSYIGMAPGNNAQVVVAVNVQDPKTTTDYFGDEVAGPVFYSVMNTALQDQQIQPQPGLAAPYVRLNAS